jgi:RNA polymerase sigma factor (sigma-70 family)
MHDATDMDLLRQYAAGNSDAAFAELVSRHVDLVYSAALRKTGNPHAAEEITQAVFIILAQKAGRILDKTILPGWLYQTARLTASSFLRRETRRIRREQEAFMQTEPYTVAPDETWEHLAPLLEDAMGQLGDQDRAAVVLRFFGGKSFAEVAATAGVSENAAKKRVGHALDKLRCYFSKRGVSSTTAIIAGAISANSVQAAPVALAKAVTAVALAKGAVASGSTLTLIKGALKLMAWTKAKMAIVAGVGVLLAAGTTTIAVKTTTAPSTSFVRIVGEAQILLYTKQPEVIGRARLVILTDGKSYRISNDSEDVSSQKALKKTPGERWAYDVKGDYGCDGTDLFLVSDLPSPLNRTGNGLSGFAYPGRFPCGDDAPMVQAAWLAYCSSDYFNTSIHQTGLPLALGFTAMTLPDYITNQVADWPDSTLPQTITGWSRNCVVFPRANSLQPIETTELKQYPNGYKSWKFTASDPVVVGNMKLPRQFTLESFYPKSSDVPLSGDEVEPLRKLTFVAQSIEVGKGRFDPLPPVTVPDLQVVDWRFKDISWNFVISSHATPEGWPTRGSKGFKQAVAEAGKLASQNRAFIESERKKAQAAVPPP